MTFAADASARGPRGGGGRAGGFGGAPGGARSFSPGAGGARPSGARPANVGRPATPPAALTGRSPGRSLPASTQQALGGRAFSANEAGQVQQWLGAKAPPAASGAAARYGQHAQAAASQFQNGLQPFSPAWYAQHPNAWQATHPHADAAAVATAAGVTAWFAGAAYAYPVESTSSTTVVYANVDQPVVSEAATVVTTTAEAPLAASTPSAEEWLSLGVFELKPQRGAAASQVVQLSVDRAAQLRGSYYDIVSGATQNLTGSIDPESGAVWWSLDASPGVTFSTTLDELTSGAGAVTVTLASGRQTLQIERQAGP